MKTIGNHNYFVYITTNPNKTVVYVGFTNDLERRLFEHFSASGNPSSFAGKYYCYNLVYFEWFQDSIAGINREKQIKGWRREKKDWLIASVNPSWLFVTDSYFRDKWQDVCGNLAYVQEHQTWPNHLR